MAKNQGEPRKMTYTSEMEFFFGMVPMESFNPGHTGDLPYRKNHVSKTKNLLSAPNTQVLGSKLHIFVHNGPM